MDNFTIKKVVDAYMELGSVRKTSAALKLCWETVTKSLVTYGVYPKGKCADANRLRIAGWSEEAICEELGISAHTYWAYMPYTKGSYLIDSSRKTVNARRIAAHRRRKAEESQKERNKTSDEENHQ